MTLFDLMNDMSKHGLLVSMVETNLNVYISHNKADLSMCTVLAKNCSQNMTAEILRQAFLKKENQFFEFSDCSTRENLSNHVPITTVGLILTKLG